MPRSMTLQQVIGKHPAGFRVPSYQRHYLWGRTRDDGSDSVTVLTRDLVAACRTGEPYFLQSITIRGNTLVDGQQRLTYLALLLAALGRPGLLRLAYDSRPDAQRWMDRADYADTAENPDEDSQDVYYFKYTLRTIDRILDDAAVDRAALLGYVLGRVEMLYMPLDDDADEIAVYKMMNGTKTRMDAADIIKADLLRRASVPADGTDEWRLLQLRARYTAEWNGWRRWWLDAAVREYYRPMGEAGVDLLLKLVMRPAGSDYASPLTYGEIARCVEARDSAPADAARALFDRLMHTQRRFEQAYRDTTAYNRLRAVMLLQHRDRLYGFLREYFVDGSIDEAELLRYYKLSFLGMTVDEIRSHAPVAERFDDLLASLSMADVYHSDTKRDVFNLLLRLNIDEDTKLGRRFDFSIWHNRSLEHIYSKSKVWHTDARGNVLDGNDNPLRIPRQKIAGDPTFMPRSRIVNHDGARLSEHCIGNLVLLYGENNAAFGNATFERKKAMFLSPGDGTVFQSRNLLHTVCVFAGNTWDHTSIVDNYNLTLKNLKTYYGIRRDTDAKQ